MTAGSLRRIERLNYLFGGVLVIAAALTRVRSEALGVAIGVFLTSLNFFLLRRLVFRVTSEAARGDSTRGALLILPKMLGLMAAVVLSLWLLPISPVAFAIGYSVFVASIFVEVILAAVLPAPASDDGAAGTADQPTDNPTS
ncbi:MAG: ATP synthase subunit I [Planctomycetes bacterium]|nr:ATP synthase subunit I [Myxococcales bacterium]MCB9572583.1 ATP synthase subunit I [Kofleriaceae bacterium]MCB9830246.1 ATP synthase subunit I [Planctomycetota bacterium]